MIENIQNTDKTYFNFYFLSFKFHGILKVRKGGSTVWRSLTSGQPLPVPPQWQVCGGSFFSAKDRAEFLVSLDLGG